MPMTIEKTWTITGDILTVPCEDPALPPRIYNIQTDDLSRLQADVDTGLVRLGGRVIYADHPELRKNPPSAEDFFAGHGLTVPDMAADEYKAPRAPSIERTMRRAGQDPNTWWDGHSKHCSFGGMSCLYWLADPECRQDHPCIHVHGPGAKCPLEA
jgi:hypothetical protein